MKPKTKTELTLVLPQPWWTVTQLLIVCALGISLFLLWGSWSGEPLPGCGAESGCGTVLHSRWAYLLGLPVSLPAALLYIATLATLFIQKYTASPFTRQRTWYFLCFAATAVLGAALWFIGLQLLVIQAICPFCMTAHVCGGTVGLILLSHIPSATPESNKRKTAMPAPSPVSKAMAGKFVLAGAASVLVMSAGQALYQPKTFRVQTMTAGGHIVTNLAVPPQALTSPPSMLNASPQQAASTNHAVSKPAPHRLLLLHDDAFSLDLNELPVLGSPLAQHVMVHLFDYSCHYCRQLHPLLVEASHQWSNDLAIVCLPMPLDSNCNPVVKVRIPDHTNACAYAKIGLAVWRAQREKSHEFDDWLFTPPRPPSPEEARAQAIQLVGSNAFEHAFNDPWIQQQLELSIRLYVTNRARYRTGRMPQLIVGTNLISGVIRTNAFYSILSNQFNLHLTASLTNN